MKRPVSITLVGWLFVATGCIVIGAGLVRFSSAAEGASARELGDFAWVVLSGLIAIAGGALTLRGSASGRWLLVVWMAGHLVLGLMHELPQLLIHIVIFAPLFFLLFRRPASAFFHGAEADAT